MNPSEKPMTKEQKRRNEYYKKVNKFLLNPEFNYLNKLQGADLYIVVDHLIAGESLEKLRIKMKRRFGMKNKDITKLFNHMKNKFKDLSR